MNMISASRKSSCYWQRRVLLVVCLFTRHASAESPDDPPNLGHQTSSPEVDSAKYCPSDAIAAVRIGNLAEFRKGFNKSTLGAQANDPALKTFFDGFLKKFSSVTNETGVPIDEIWTRVDGELSLCLIKKRDGLLSSIAVANFRDETASAKFVDQIEQQMALESADLTSIQLGHNQLRSWQRRPRQTFSNLNFFVRGNQVVFAEDLQTLAEAAKRVDDPDAVKLARNANYRHVMSRITGTASGLNWYVNPREAIGFAVTAEIGSTPIAATIQQFIDAIGFGQVLGIGGTLWLGQGGMDSVSTVYGHVQTPLDGILKTVWLPPTAQSPPDWVKEDVSLYAQLNWSGERFIDTVQEIVDGFRGPGAFKESFGSVQVTGDGASLIDVARGIQGPIHIAAQFPERMEDLLKQKTTIGFGISNPELFRRMAHESGKSQTVATRKFGQVEFLRRHLHLGDAFPEMKDKLSIELGIAVTNDTVLISLNPDDLIETLRDDGYRSPLSKTVAYQTIASKFPKATSMISYQRQDGRLEGLYEQLRGVNSSRIPMIARTISGIDFESLPPFLKVFPYLQTSGGFIVPEEDGFRSVTITLPSTQRGPGLVP